MIRLERDWESEIEIYKQIMSFRENCVNYILYTSNWNKTLRKKDDICVAKYNFKDFRVKT